MEDIDGGLHPAVEGQSLDKDEDECVCVEIMYMKASAVMKKRRNGQ